MKPICVAVVPYSRVLTALDRLTDRGIDVFLEDHHPSAYKVHVACKHSANAKGLLSDLHQNRNDAMEAGR